MDGPTFLYYGHLIGIAFVTLWMLATTLGEGWWGIFLVMAGWIISIGLAWTLAIPLGALIVGWTADPEAETPFMAYFVYLAVSSILVLAFFIPIRMATDKLSRMKVAYPSWFEMLKYPFALALGPTICVTFLLFFNSKAVLKAWFAAMGAP